MAIGRLCMKVGKAGKAGPHAAYIAREGKYAARLDRNEKLEAKESGNMPTWAQHSPQEFWNAADRNERKNGTTYREMEIALPRELTTDQRVELVRDFVRKEIGTRHAYQWAIHSPKAADGGEQPHAHLMFSERQRDHIARDPEQYFKRYNSKNPESGGARKGYGPSAGMTLTAVERKAELRDLRARWEQVCNKHLERAGLPDRIDMRSHSERQTGLLPERKCLPSEWRSKEVRAKVIDFRSARADLLASRRMLQREIPSTGAEIVILENERLAREKRKNETSTIKAAIHEGGDEMALSKNTDLAAKKKDASVQASVQEAARIATTLSLQNERRENLQTMEGRHPDAESRDLELKKRAEQEKSIREQSQRMEQAKRDEQDRLINHLQRTYDQKSTGEQSATVNLNAGESLPARADSRSLGHDRKVSSIEQMRSRAEEKGHIRVARQSPEKQERDAPVKLEEMRRKAQSREAGKVQENDAPDMER